MTKELRLLGLLVATAMLVFSFALNVLSGFMVLNVVACVANLPEFYDTVVRKRESFLEHLWAAYGWPIWGIYAWLRLKSQCPF